MVERPVTTNWTRSADIAGQIEQLWRRGRILRASLVGEPVFPFTARMRRPDTKTLAGEFDEVRKWIRELEEGSKAARGFGYVITWTETHHRQLGRNRVPTRVSVETEDDALRLIGKERDAQRFRQLVAATVGTFPMLSDWLARAPLTALEHANDWDRILAVLTWFRDHPRCGRYVRELDIPSVDSKFIEERRGILAELLDRILSSEAITSALSGVRNFEGRYGLRSKPALIRFRVLDERLQVHGLSDMTVPATEFTQLDLSVKRVFVTENEVNGLAFPMVADSLVVFGLGYGLELLLSSEWLKSKAIYYWGDIDTHGFALLDRLRGAFPAARSFLMDRDTLLGHRALWGREGKDERLMKPLTRLNEEERALFEDLQQDRLGESVRLEQERIGFGYVERALGEIVLSE